MDQDVEEPLLSSYILPVDQTTSVNYTSPAESISVENVQIPGAIDEGQPSRKKFKKQKKDKKQKSQ